MLNFCSNCGHRIEDSNPNFCPKCGEKLSTNKSLDTTNLNKKNISANFLGNKFEENVENILKSKGLVTKRRLKIKGKSGAHHEIDIIAQKDRSTIFVEVTTLSDNFTVTIAPSAILSAVIEELAILSLVIAPSATLIDMIDPSIRSCAVIAPLIIFAEVIVPSLSFTATTASSAIFAVVMALSSMFPVPSGGKMLGDTYTNAIVVAKQRIHVTRIIGIAFFNANDIKNTS